MPRIADRFVRYTELLDDWEEFADCLETRLPTCVWAHPHRVDAEAAAAMLGEIDAEPRPLAWRGAAWRIHKSPRLGRSWMWSSGLFHHQEEVSCMPVALLDPQPGERVLDLCAAPGGKTAQIALAVGREGVVIANEPRVARHRPLRQIIERLGLTNVVCTRNDGTRLNPALGPFDRVLVDAPCSCEGTTRKSAHTGERPERLARHEMAILQRRLLEHAVTLCRPGGRIVYSTCTFAPEENEGVIDEVLARRGSELDLEVARIEGLRTRPGITAWEGRSYDPRVARTARVWPHDNDTGGFFMAVLTKRGSSASMATAPPLAPCTDTALIHELFVAEHGIPEESLADLGVTHVGGKGIYVGGRALGEEALTDVETRGIRFVRTKRTPPKPTTAAALELGRTAQRKVLPLDADQVDDFRGGLSFIPKPNQLDAVPEPGYVLVTHRGHPLGTGIWHRRSGELESLFPKAWAPRRTP